MGAARREGTAAANVSLLIGRRTKQPARGSYSAPSRSLVHLLGGASVYRLSQKRFVNIFMFLKIIFLLFSFLYKILKFGFEFMFCVSINNEGAEVEVGVEVVGVGKILPSVALDQWKISCGSPNPALD